MLQVESYALVLRQLLRGRQPYRLVDFGAGSGNLLLPLAALFPWCSFHAVEMKPNAVHILLSRAAAAGLANVTAEVCSMIPVGNKADLPSIWFREPLPCL